MSPLQFENHENHDSPAKYGHILSEFHRSTWAILPDKFAVLQGFLKLKAAGGHISAEEIALIKREAREPYLVEAEPGFQAAAVPYQKGEAKDAAGAWDGSGARDRLAKWASSDGSGDKDTINWTKYRQGFAWYDSANAKSFGAYKFPHHDVKNGKLTLVWGGVKAAMGALLGARGGTSIPSSERKAVYNHLAKHYREFDQDPPDYHGEASGIGFEAYAAECEARAGDPQNPARTKDGSQIAVLPLTGVISHRMGMLSQYSGSSSTEQFTQWLRSAVADPQVKAIVIDADSPGGTVDGVPELADEIYRSSKIKPIVGVANAVAASAAYWLLSQAGEIAITPSGQVGSIGVFGSHDDRSKQAEMQGVKTSLISAGKYKTEGNPFEPLSDDGRQAIQDGVNSFYDLFTKAVARGRETDQDKVKSGFMEGRMATAQQAVKKGMADRVATLDQTLARLGAKTATSKSGLAAQAGFSATAAEDEADEPDDQNDDQNDKNSPCGCKAMNGRACHACKACTGAGAKKADGEMDNSNGEGCACACHACKGCVNRAEDEAKAKREANLALQRMYLHLL
jgi:signal peptide peptidase SppA